MVAVDIAVTVVVDCCYCCSLLLIVAIVVFIPSFCFCYAALGGIKN